MILSGNLVPINVTALYFGQGKDVFPIFTDKYITIRTASPQPQGGEWEKMVICRGHFKSVGIWTYV